MNGGKVEALVEIARGESSLIYQHHGHRISFLRLCRKGNTRHHSDMHREMPGGRQQTALPIGELKQAIAPARWPASSAQEVRHDLEGRHAAGQPGAVTWNAGSEYVLGLQGVRGSQTQCFLAGTDGQPTNEPPRPEEASQLFL